MCSYVLLCRKEGDFGLMIDFHRKRAIVRANTAWIKGIYLEEIPEGYNGFHPGMVLVKYDWGSLYFLRERRGWEEEDYFDRAKELMKEKKLSHDYLD